VTGDVSVSDTQSRLRVVRGQNAGAKALACGPWLLTLPRRPFQSILCGKTAGSGPRRVKKSGIDLLSQFAISFISLSFTPISVLGSLNYAPTLIMASNSNNPNDKHITIDTSAAAPRQSIENDFYANDPHAPVRRSSRRSGGSGQPPLENDVTRKSSIHSKTAPIPVMGASVPLALPEETVEQPPQQQRQEADLKSPTKLPIEKSTSGIELDPFQPQQQQQGETAEGEAAAAAGSGGLFACFGRGKKQEHKKKIEAVSYWQLYRFASRRDWLYVM